MMQINTQCCKYIQNVMITYTIIYENEQKECQILQLRLLTSLCSFQYNYTLSEITHVIFLICTLHS